MKSKDSKESVRAFSNMITKKIVPRNFGLTWGQSLLESLQNFVKLKKYKSTLQTSETKAVFLNPLKHSLPLHGILGYKQIHMLPPFVITLNSRKNCLIDLKTKEDKNSDFLSIVYSKPRREYSNRTGKTKDTVGISKYELIFQKGHNSQFTQEIF